MEPLEFGGDFEVVEHFPLDQLEALLHPLAAVGGAEHLVVGLYVLPELLVGLLLAVRAGDRGVPVYHPAYEAGKLEAASEQLLALSVAAPLRLGVGQRHVLEGVVPVEFYEGSQFAEVPVLYLGGRLVHQHVELGLGYLGDGEGDFGLDEEDQQDGLELPDGLGVGARNDPGHEPGFEDDVPEQILEPFVPPFVDVQS